MISHKYKVLFFHIPKTGGTSLEDALEMRINQDGCAGRHDCRGIKGKEIYSENWDYLKFSFVRNPWDRVVSIYQYYKHGTEPENWEFRTDDKILEPTFKEFIFGVRNESHRLYSLVGLPQKDWLFDQDGNQLVDFIGRFEKYSDDVNKLFQKIGCNKQIGHARKSKRGPYRDYYDDETRNIIR